MADGKYLTLNLAKVGDDHIALIRNGTDEDLDEVNRWMRSMRAQAHAAPQVFAVHPADAPINTGKPAPEIRTHRDHPAFKMEPATEPIGATG